MKLEQPQLTYQSLLSHCKLLEVRYKQYQRLRRGDVLISANHIGLQHPPYTLIPLPPQPTTAATSVAIPILYQVPAYSQQCYACSGSNNFMATLQAEKTAQTSKPLHQDDYTPRGLTSIVDATPAALLKALLPEL